MADFQTDGDLRIVLSVDYLRNVLTDCLLVEWAGIGLDIVCEDVDCDIIPSMFDDVKCEKSSEPDDMPFKSLCVMVCDG